MSIASRIEAIEQHLTDDYSVLTLAGADLTNVDKNIVNLKPTWKERLLYFMNNGTDEVWNNWDKVTGEGEEISLNNTLEAKMKIELKGNTYQDSTTGKNLANINNIDDIDSTNLKLVINNDTIILSNNGNSAGYANSNTTMSELCPNLQIGDTIYLFFNTTSSSSNKNIIYLNGYNHSLSNNGGTLTITQEILDSNVCFYGGYQKTAIISNFMITKVNDRTYEPYTNGASPNPDYPQDVEVVTGDNTINICGVNILPLSANDLTFNRYIGNDGTYKVTTSGNYYASEEYIKFIHSGETITLSTGLEVAYYDKNKTFIRYVGRAGSRVEAVPNNAEYIRIDCYKDNINELMIYLGDTAIPYEPYQSQSYAVNLGDIELCKIGTYQDYFYKDSSKWYKYNAIGKIVLNGSEEWIVGSTGTANWFYQVQTTLENKSNGSELSNYYKYTGSIGGTTTNNGIFVTGNSLVRIRYGEEDTISNYKNWLSTHNLEVYCVSTPTYTEITDSTLISQLEALKKARSYTSQTNINQNNTDLPFIINATALKEMS